MERDEATFTIDSKTAACAIGRLLERLHDSLREASRTSRDGTGDSSDRLVPLARVRDATRDLSPGSPTIVYRTTGRRSQ